jgi:signal transduction histidine kinase
LTIAGISALVLVVADSIARGWSLGDSISRCALAGAATAYGLYIGTRRAYIVALRETAMRLERERSLLAQQAVADERVRIARELHDFIAHHVTLLVVQAGAVRETLPADHSARPMLDSMASTGRQALDEMRRMLGLLRTEHGRPAMAPLPGLGEVNGLIEQARAAGLLVEMRVAGEPRALPVGVDLSAYRIVQEALTNVLNHAGRVATRVDVAYTPTHIQLDVLNQQSANTSTAPAEGGGRGLIGMGERVAAYGGSLQAGAVASGGFHVVARIPLP